MSSRLAVLGIALAISSAAAVADDAPGDAGLDAGVARGGAPGDADVARGAPVDAGVARGGAPVDGGVARGAPVDAGVDGGVARGALVDGGVERGAPVDGGVARGALVGGGVARGAPVDAGVARGGAPVDAGVTAPTALPPASDATAGPVVGAPADATAGPVVGAPADATAGPVAGAPADATAGPVVGAPADAVPGPVVGGATADDDTDGGAVADTVAPRDPIDHQPITRAEPVTSATTTESTLFAIKVIGGLIALLVLAYLGGNRRVVRFQERLGISGVITGGFPFIALGVVASLPSVGILTGDVLENLRPVLMFGLGWLGFIIGAQLDIRVLERVPRGTAYVILVESILPFALVGVASGAVMIAFGRSWRDPTTWRDVALLGIAASMTAPRRFRGFASRMWREGHSADVLLAQLDEVVGVIGLLFISAYFRTSGAWQIPDTVWVFVALGVGVAAGALIFAMIRMPSSNAEFLAIMLGSIAFASGFAGYLRLSPIVICFVAGVLVTNFPNEAREQAFRILRRLERPVQLLFLIVAGSVWSVFDWRGWVLVPVFVAARIAGKFLGTVASKTVLSADVHAEAHADRNIVTPLSVLSVALVISAEHTYAHSGSLSWIVTAVIGGALVNELLLQALPSKDPPVSQPPPETPLAIDELDDGPIYRDEDAT